MLYTADLTSASSSLAQNLRVLNTLLFPNLQLPILCLLSSRQFIFLNGHGLFAMRRRTKTVSCSRPEIERG